MDEQRKDTRKKLMAFTPVYDLLSNTLLGYVGNINMLGVMVVSEHLIDAGKNIIIDIQIPDPLEVEGIFGQSLQVPARIAWSRPDADSGNYRLGLEFTKITPEQKLFIQAILKRYHFDYEVE